MASRPKGPKAKDLVISQPPARNGHNKPTEVSVNANALRINDYRFLLNSLAGNEKGIEAELKMFEILDRAVVCDFDYGELPYSELIKLIAQIVEVFQTAKTEGN